MVSLSAGCGSRTSTLDPNTYAFEGAPVGGFASSGGSKGTSGSAGKGGSKNNPDPTRTAKACQAYCNGFAVHCSAELGGRDCVDTCTQEVNGNGEKCKPFALGALECLAPYFADPSLGCEGAKTTGTTNCAQELASYGTCRPDGQPDPQPQPNPDPLPGERPIPSAGSPASCGGAGSYVPGSCFQAYSCQEGAYVVQCMQQADASYSCSCTFPDGATSNAFNVESSDACLQASLDCGLY